ncbi:hypothetical protein E4633_18725 [Geomonas terrae]|uniref:Uncharacterized protein n=1 Tax=Geomonas terrae TaxID=2562681 RepID=A0A4S1CAC1_9BACT|nr:hypothetical protein [Geomonas terrae]TGU70235.1 hypothetical protein E4633_18725 [Geomonas terrae]
MSDMENQMGLFEAAPAPVPPPAPAMQAAQPAPKALQKSPASTVREAPAKSPSPRKGAAPGRKKTPLSKAAPKGVSGLVPEGDVRLTANIRQDLHLKLKIASAYRRTTIGEILEELIEKYV